jgi:PEP-CTERM motif
VRTPKLALPSLIVAVTLSISSILNAQVTGFGGSTNTGWTPNGNTAGFPNVVGIGTAADVLNLTTTTNGVASSYWFNTPQSITNFSESFTYTDTSTNGADGIAAVWQNVGTNALGGGGGSLGFANLASSAGLAMNIYSGNSGSGSEYNDTITAGSPSTTPTPGGVNIDSGDPINVFLSYKESDHALTETMTDTSTNATFTRVWRGISIQSQVGGTTALVGLTGATGGVNAAQSVTNFHFSPGSASATPVAHIAPISTTGYNQNMIISAANGVANVTATMDGGTAKTGATFYEKGVNSGATSAGVPHAGVVFGSGADSNHTFALQPNGQGQNDALMLDSDHTTGTLKLTSPAIYTALSLLVAGANGGGNINVTVNYAGGGTQTAVIPAPDWFNNGPIAFDANGRATLSLGFDSTTSGNPRIYQEDLTLTDTTDAVNSIDVSWGGSNREPIFGVSGQAVPEPTSLVLLALGAIGLLSRRRLARA